MLKTRHALACPKLSIQIVTISMPMVSVIAFIPEQRRHAMPGVGIMDSPFFD